MGLWLFASYHIAPSNVSFPVRRYAFLLTNHPVAQITKYATVRDDNTLSVRLIIVKQNQNF